MSTQNLPPYMSPPWWRPTRLARPTRALRPTAEAGGIASRWQKPGHAPAKVGRSLARRSLERELREVCDTNMVIAAHGWVRRRRCYDRVLHAHAHDQGAEQESRKANRPTTLYPKEMERVRLETSCAEQERQTAAVKAATKKDEARKEAKRIKHVAANERKKVDLATGRARPSWHSPSSSRWPRPPPRSRRRSTRRHVFSGQSCRSNPARRCQLTDTG